MMNRILALVLSALALSACAHHRAVRVECDGPLRPINPPAKAPSIEDTVLRAGVALPVTDLEGAVHGR